MAELVSGGITTVVTPVAAMGETGMEAGLSSDDGVGSRHGDGVADAAEGVVAAIAAAGGDDEVVFAAGDWVAEDDFACDQNWRDGRTFRANFPRPCGLVV